MKKKFMFGHRLTMKKNIYQTLLSMRSLLLYVFLLFVILSTTGCQRTVTPVTMQGFYFDTIVSITFYEEDTEKLETLKNECMTLMTGCENTFSRTVEGSDIWNINHSDGVPVTVSDETIFLLNKALYYAGLSDGLVDPTIGTLSTLWNFGNENEKKVPSDTEIQKALSHVNYQNIIIDGNTVTLTDPAAIIDLGFIAKGYIADLLKEYLLSQGVKSAIINLGGNVLTIGNKPDGTPYQVGIQEPFSKTGTPLLSLPVTDRSLVSSGNYERYFEKDGILYHHILSTCDGMPADSGLMQVTIISSSSADGDALSTLCFILGYEEGSKLVESLPDTEAVFVMKDGEIRKTF